MSPWLKKRRWLWVDVLLLLLLGAVATLWAVSSRWYVVAAAGQVQKSGVALFSVRGEVGTIVLWGGTPPAGGSRFTWGCKVHDAEPIVFWPPFVKLEERYDVGVSRWVAYTYDGMRINVFFVRHWLVCALLAALLAPRLAARAIAARLRRVRRRHGRCPECGYDLRASPRRCPECGKPVTAATIDRGRSRQGAAKGTCPSWLAPAVALASTAVGPSCRAAEVLMIDCDTVAVFVVWDAEAIAVQAEDKPDRPLTLPRRPPRVVYRIEVEGERAADLVPYGSGGLLVAPRRWRTRRFEVGTSRHIALGYRAFWTVIRLR